MHRITVPKLRLLSEPVVLKIIDEARDILKKVGVQIENEKALHLLSDHGLFVDRSKNTVRFSQDVIDAALKTVPEGMEIFDRAGKLSMYVGGQNVYFNPGSAALHLLDFHTNRSRKAKTNDVWAFVTLVDALPNFAAQSTGLIASDVPETISDRYRLYLALQFGRKPVITGTFSLDGFSVMKEMLLAVRGSEQNLAEKPLAIFDCCPSPPLKWSKLTCHDLMACAASGIPAELVSMPLTGATAPVTILGALVQLTAENLSGVVIHQLTKPGAPIIFGGSPAAFDMRTGTTPMGAIETMMIDSAYAQIGRQLGMPTHAYMALSDAKMLDVQAGFETGMGAILAALSGINVVSGPGMLDFESCQSLEKLVVDHEICGQALRLKSGIFAHGEMFADDLYDDIYESDFFLTSPNTLKYFRKEFYFPDPIVERRNLQDWLVGGADSVLDRAHKRVENLLSSHRIEPLDSEVQNELKSIMTLSAKAAGLQKLPAVQPE